MTPSLTFNGAVEKLDWLFRSHRKLYSTRCESLAAQVPHWSSRPRSRWVVFLDVGSIAIRILIAHSVWGDPTQAEKKKNRWPTFVFFEGFWRIICILGLFWDVQISHKHKGLCGRLHAVVSPRSWRSVRCQPWCLCVPRAAGIWYMEWCACHLNGTGHGNVMGGGTRWGKTCTQSAAISGDDTKLFDCSGLW